tara:strand:+ start:156 stop:389 length:234 start_codon:yes stop_codon:yes gene_type:complete
MKKIFIIIIFTTFINTGVTLSAEKPCSEFNYWTENWKYKKCMEKAKGGNKVNKFLSGINKKYKNLREKAPKTLMEGN